MLDDLVFLHGGYADRCIASVDKHFDYYTLQYMARGSVWLAYDERAATLSGRWLWPCHPGPLIRFHEWPRGQPWEHRYIAFTGPRVAVWEADGLLLRAPEPVDAGSAGQLAGLFDRVIELAGQPGPWPRRRAANHLERILVERAEARAGRSPGRPEWLASVLTGLADPAGEPDYALLARGVAMSLSTLRRRFRAATGTSLHLYRLECRVAHARRLLGDTDEPIKQVAARLGYTDVSYFTRQFRQLCGVSPAVYRRTRQP